MRVSLPLRSTRAPCFQDEPGASKQLDEHAQVGDSAAGPEQREPMEALALAGTDALVKPYARSGFMLGDEASLSDEQLLKYCAEGESAALRELVRRHQAPLYRFLYRLMGSEEDAEEAVSDVFVRAWRNAGRFQ